MYVPSPNSAYGLTGSFTSPSPHQVYPIHFPDSSPFSSLPTPDGTPGHSKPLSIPTHLSVCWPSISNNSQRPAAPARPPALEHPHVPRAYCPSHTHPHPRGLHPQHPHTHPSGPSPGHAHWFLRTHPIARGLPILPHPNALQPLPARRGRRDGNRPSAPRRAPAPRRDQHRGELRAGRASAPRRAPRPPTHPRGVGVPPGAGWGGPPVSQVGDPNLRYVSPFPATARPQVRVSLPTPLPVCACPRAPRFFPPSPPNPAVSPTGAPRTCRRFGRTGPPAADRGSGTGAAGAAPRTPAPSSSRRRCPE